MIRAAEALVWVKGYWFNLDKQAMEHAQKVLEVEPNNVHVKYVLVLGADTEEE